MNRVRAALLLAAAAVVAGCAGTGGYRTACGDAAPAAALPAGGTVVVAETAAVPGPAAAWPVYDACPFCGGETTFFVDASLDLHCYSCPSCATVMYGWRDGAAWAQQSGDDGLRAWRLYGTRAVAVECVPFVTPPPVAVRREAAPVARRTPRRSESRTQAYDSGGGFLVATSVRRTGHPTGLPGHPTGLPGASVGLPGHPVTRPAHPTGLPAAPVERPSHPVSRPAAPVALPSHPVDRPAAPVERPSHPVERASHPLMPLASAAHEASTRAGRTPGPRNALDGVLFNRGR